VLKRLYSIIGLKLYIQAMENAKYITKDLPEPTNRKNAGDNILFRIQRTCDSIMPAKWLSNFMASIIFVLLGSFLICIKEYFHASAIFNATKTAYLHHVFDQKTAAGDRLPYDQLDENLKQMVRDYFGTKINKEHYRAKRTAVENSVQLVLQLALLVHRIYWQPVAELDIRDNFVGIQSYTFWSFKIALSIIGAATSAYTTFYQSIESEEFVYRMKHNEPLGRGYYSIHFSLKDHYMGSKLS